MVVCYPPAGLPMENYCFFLTARFHSHLGYGYCRYRATTSLVPFQMPRLAPRVASFLPTASGSHSPRASPGPTRYTLCRSIVHSRPLRLPRAAANGRSPLVAAVVHDGGVTVKKSIGSRQEGRSW